MNTTHSTKKKLLAQALGITAAAVLGVLADGAPPLPTDTMLSTRRDLRRQPTAPNSVSRHRARRPVERHIVYGAGVQHSGLVATLAARPTFRSRRTRRTRLGRGADGALRTADGRYGSRRRETRYWLLPTRMSVPPAGLGS